MFTNEKGINFIVEKQEKRINKTFSVVVDTLLKSVFISISHFLPLSHLDKKDRMYELNAPVKITNLVSGSL